VDTKRDIIKIIQESDPEFYSASEGLRAQDCWAEASTLSEAREWERRARWEGNATIIAAVSSRAEGKVVRSQNGNQRMFGIFIRRKK
jgi:hypothetical protein